MDPFIWVHLDIWIFELPGGRSAEARGGEIISG